MILLSLSSMLSIYLCSYATHRRRLPGAAIFSFLTLGCAFYSAGYALELSRIELGDMLWAIRIEYLGLATMPVLSFLLALRLLRERSLGPGIVCALLAVPALVLVLVWTSPSHSLYYADPRVSNLGPYAVFAFERGPLYAATAAYQTVMMSASLALFLARALRTRGRKRAQSAMLAAGGALPLVDAYLYLLRVYPDGLDPGAPTLSLSALLYAVALFKLGLFELVPAARALALDSIEEGFIVMDSKGRLQDMNRAARALPGLVAAKEGEGIPASSPLAGGLPPLVRGEGGCAELSLVDAEGRARRYEARSYPVLERRSVHQGTAILLSDITEKALLLERLDALARTDFLTGLLNRRSLVESGTREVERSRRDGSPVGVLIVDIDFFKAVNDDFGHDAGDETLKALSSVLAAALRSVDILGRYGGEEFVAVLPGADLAASLAAAERLRAAAAAAEIASGGRRIRITVSIGVHSQSAEAGTDIERFISLADEALYLAKQRGRNRVCAYRGGGPEA